MKEIIKNKAERFQSTHQRNFNILIYEAPIIKEDMSDLEFIAAAIFLKKLDGKRPAINDKIKEIVEQYYMKDNDPYFNNLVTAYLKEIAPDNLDGLSANKCIQIVYDKLHPLFNYIGFNDCINELAKKTLEYSPNPH